MALFLQLQRHLPSPPYPPVCEAALIDDLPAQSHLSASCRLRRRVGVDEVQVLIATEHLRALFPESTHFPKSTNPNDKAALAQSTTLGPCLSKGTRLSQLLKP